MVKNGVICFCKLTLHMSWSIFKMVANCIKNAELSDYIFSHSNFWEARKVFFYSHLQAAVTKKTCKLLLLNYI